MDAAHTKENFRNRGDHAAPGPRAQRAALARLRMSIKTKKLHCTIVQCSFILLYSLQFMAISEEV